MLLRHEAIEAGVQANNDEVQNILTTYYQRPPGTDEMMDEAAQQAVTDLLLIEANFNRLAGNLKVSQPQRDHFLAEAGQAIQLSVVELTDADYLAKVPPPTTQQAQEQFTKFADAVPGHPDEQNPFGVGYRFPDGVKLQYLSIDIDDARKTVEATQTPYDWDVKGRLYYLQHKDEFPSTQPTDAIGPTSQPSVLPYSQVALEALEKLREPLVTKLMFDVQGKILSKMQVGWREYSQNPSTAGGNYPSYAYLQNLAGEVQAQYGMKVYPTEMDRDFLSQVQLDRLPEIGHSSNGRMDFAPYAMQLASSHFARADKGSPVAAAQLMQPAAPLKDIDGNVYIFRLTDARRAQAAPSVDDVAPKVDADLRNQAAYKLAQDAAGPLLAATRNGSLLPAASAMGKFIWMTPPFSKPFGGGYVELGKDIILSPEGDKEFVQQAFGLLSQYNPDTNSHPARLIELPAEGKVYIAELLHVAPRWNQANFFNYSLEVARELHQDQLIKLRAGWMQYDAVTQRLNYKPDSGSKDSSS
jgi:hypothetical protein